MPSGNSHWLVEVSDRGAPIALILCSSKKAAEETAAWSQANDKFGWHADYAVRPLDKIEQHHLAGV